MTASRERPGDGWHALAAAEVLARLESGAAGLDTEEAARRLAAHGPNRLPPAKRRGPIARFVAQFDNVLIYVLLAAGAVTLVQGHLVDASVIFGVIVINAIIGFIQEGKAERALEAIAAMLSMSAVRLSRGRKTVVATTELVPGDVVLLQAGDKVPADLRLIEARSLRIQEASLTGESVPVDKLTQAMSSDTPLAERQCMAFSGTLVAAGHGCGVVVATGRDTEIGRISDMLAEVTTLTTPLLRQMAHFSRWLSFACLALAVGAFAFGVLVRSFTVDEMFLAAVGIAVAAIPEGLPAVMTITLAIGVQRMARRNAIIRRLPAVETLGAVTVICSDKTGTLTRDEMTVRTVGVGGRVLEVTGTGYAPRGEFLDDGGPVPPAEIPALVELARAALLCGDADLQREGEHWLVAGDPSEGALVAMAGKAGIAADKARRDHPRLDVIPFESERRFMATLHRRPDGGGGILLVKGAPERLLPMCGGQRDADGGVAALDSSYWHGFIDAVARHGERLLAVAMKPTDADHLDEHMVEHDLILLGMVGLIDPPRDEAMQSYRQVRDAGIDVKMITGDHAVTAAAIGMKLGMDSPEVLTGNDVDRLSESELRDAACATTIFARTAPEHKLRLVEALQACGHVVAMTGDGVNDAPALKRADIGVAMGRKGTEVAKEAAGMVLVDDNFASIAHAVEEGRIVYDNLKKAIVFILPTNGGEALVLVTAILLDLALPITPKQILWVNMITAVTLALALAFEPAEPGLMRRPPRPPDAPLLSPFLVWRIAFVSLLLVVASLGLFLWEIDQGADLATARTAAVNALVMGMIGYLWNARLLHASALTRRGLLGSKPVLISVALVILFQLLFTYAPPLQALFDTAGLGLDAWIRIAGLGLFVFVAVEIEKALLWLLGSKRG